MRILPPLILLLFVAACGGGGDSSSNNNQVDTAPATPPDTTSPPADNPTDPSSVCDASPTGVNWDALMNEDCNELSQYNLFADSSDPTQGPIGTGMAYQLSSELFTNYAQKYRFVFLPEASQITYRAEDTFSLPVGSVLTKTFSLPSDTQLSGREHQTVIETRLLIHRESGWTTLAYVWDQGVATLNVVGADIAHTFNHQGEQVSFDYHVPSRAECKLCHQLNDNDVSRIAPIGLKAQLLNHQIETSNGQTQLRHWQSLGMLAGLANNESIPHAPNITDDSGDLTARAKGYIDINCAHCHRSEGFASISGLRLGFHVDHTSYPYGVCKQPPGWDGGEKGLSYDIIPGDAEHSIMVYRQELNGAKDRMPPIGRAMVHTEAITVIRQWIDIMSPSIGDCQA
ncbi:SO2930 family diheme c-type cytochrome [Shewanella waksmanii]|uniref:SO2930 family diheme c-type cytochrome n=1 Tax=Shewanella waksmanii TaxID=213783 RepID=UPI000491C3AB|nr:SO2930 family diheme c-type cytochrome [Shewanella waksmanii]